MRDHLRSERACRALVAGVLVCLTALFVAGCSAATGPSSELKMPGAAGSGAGSGAQMASNSTSSKMGMKADPNAQTCAACNTGKEPTLTVGTTENVGGTQVVRVGIVGGYYSPNEFTVKAGAPVKVVFKVDGKPAKGCVSKPTFKSLNKTVTVTRGEQTLDLGALSPGTYEFTCAMGANKGRIVVQ
jgi:hypothetical protein